MVVACAWLMALGSQVAKLDLRLMTNVVEFIITKDLAFDYLTIGFL